MTSGFSGLALSAGVRRGVNLLAEVDKKKLAQLSQRIIAAIPVRDVHALFSSDERQKLVAALGLRSSSELSLVIALLVELWQQIAFKQLKLAQLRSSLQELRFSDTVVDTILEVWSKVGQPACDRLRDASFSGVPELLDVNWTLRMDVASRDVPKLKKPKAVFEFVTDEGPKHVTMSREELSALFQVLQDVQKELDGLLK